MNPDDTNVIRELIREQYLSRILSVYPSLSKQFYAKPLSQYHSLQTDVDHRELWPKRVRILGPNGVSKFKQLAFFKQLTKQLDIQGITGEEQSGWEEAYWRIVRPGDSDIGDFHADSWFWKMGHGQIESAYRRIKIWVAIETIPGKSGLRVLPGSHQNSDWRYHGEIDHTGIKKPVFDEDIDTLNIFNVSTNPGDFIVFHDDLIHAGMPNKSDSTRVSLEATLLVKKS
jgi:hypothetical protein